MNLPLNGRIVVVDDKYKEVKPLIQILSKRRIPFNYYTGLRSADLPVNANENPVTLIFLDLNIVEAQNSSKQVISTLHPILKSICPGKSKPYFLVIWSKKINEFADDLVLHFNTNKELKERNPAKIIRLNKIDYFDIVDGNYIFDEEKYELLIETLKRELENISVLKNFLTWENIVHHQTMETINEFSSFYSIDDDWNKNTKAIIYHLAKSIIGNDEISIVPDELKLQSAFVAINSFLSDKIQNSIFDNKLGKIQGIIDEKITKKNINGRLSEAIKAAINSKLHLISGNFSIESYEQGNIYNIKDENILKKKILHKKKYNNIVTTNILKSKPNLIQLDLTPVCDYSQDKQYTRFIYGLILNPRYKENGIIPVYQCQTPIFQINGKERFILFDFRYIKTMSKEEIKKRGISPFIKLRKEICTDIQSQLANQINRPGISNV